MFGDNQAAVATNAASMSEPISMPIRSEVDSHRLRSSWLTNNRNAEELIWVGSSSCVGSEWFIVTGILSERVRNRILVFRRIEVIAMVPYDERSEGGICVKASMDPLAVRVVEHQE